MLLNIGSFVLIILITGYHVYFSFHKKGLLTTSAGMSVSSVFAVLTGLAFGVASSQTFDFGLSLSVMISVMFAVIAGFALGISFGWQSAINGILSGSVGAMLGAVIGRLFFTSKSVVLVAVVLFILCSFIVQKIGDSLIRRSQPKTKKAKLAAQKPTYISSILLASCVVICGEYLLLQQDQISIGAIGQPQSQIAVIDEENDLQVATIDVSAAGMTPKSTEFKAFTMIKAIINVKPDAGTDLKIISKDLNISAELSAGQNIFLLNNPQPGTYEIEIPSKNYKGTFTVHAAK
ncbi:hypothetical protein [Paenibacillus sp.]|jgi:hypothetical protein|uniref:hypothetical protein n=1 Tax=Paenibacillus sp. TaxID=58172 RepID=UPI00281C3234|nr:hypothetical protein [Paenibacillus sp.]MDR0270545.1 hypothetical protein [Paenibacillus sp.]